MLKISQVTNDPKQVQTLLLDNGDRIIMTISYSLQQKGWFIDSLVLNDFTVNTLRISNGFNLLRQFKNQITFGLACISKNDREPSLQDDFSSGSSVLYLLTEQECIDYEVFLSV